MSAASNPEIGFRPAGRRVAAVLALLLAAGCGGERQADTGAVDTSSAAAPVSPTDTVTAVTPDTSARGQAAVEDSTSAVPTPGSSVARRSSPDTAGAAGERGAAAAKPAPKPAPAPAAQPRDTETTAAAPSRPARRQSQPAPAADTAPGTAAAADTTPTATAAADTQAAGQTLSTPGQAAADTQASGQTATAAAPTPPPQDAPLRDQYHQAPKDTVVQAVYDGWKQYNLNCARCHGEDVLGSTIAPHLVTSLKPDGPINTKESFVQVVCAGRPEKGMPAWCPLGMEMEKIEQIYSYVKGRSAGEIGPGRPALRQEG